MKHSGPRIHAVVEVAAARDDAWFDLPPEPWPAFIRLCRATTEDEVALVVGTLCSYGRLQESRPRSPDELVRAFPRALPGGLAVIGEGTTIFPSCCCGLEHWPEWRRVLSGGGTPWTGHDPAPLLEVLEGRVHVWSDGGIGPKPVSETPIEFTAAQFEHELAKVVSDLEGFVYPLSDWLEMHAPRQAKAIANKFTERFIELQS